MLLASVMVFALAAVLGLVLAGKVFGGSPRPSWLPLLHGGLAVIGSVLVIAAALQGDHRLYLNIAIAVPILILGPIISRQRNQGRRPAGLVTLHAGLAVVCYLILLYYAFM